MKVKSMENVNNIINQMISNIHRPNCNNDIPIRRALLEEKRILGEVIPLLPEKNREERTKGILNYCKGLIKTWRQKKLHSDREMYIRQANSRITEIVRRARNKIVKLDDIILELNTCKALTDLDQIQAKMPSVR